MKLRTNAPKLSWAEYHNPARWQACIWSMIVIVAIVGLIAILCHTAIWEVAFLLIGLSVLSAMLFCGDEKAEYTLWREWYFGNSGLSFEDWLDQHYVTGKEKKGKRSKRKPARDDLRALLNTDQEQCVFDFWYHSEWRAEYQDWALDYAALEKE